ncbi:MAG: uroporphyrinogen-III C-methyltransferase [Dietzia sp.]|nr:uroporphyrinogen-III C-methyltransferase [Dietzia sp.]
MAAENAAAGEDRADRAVGGGQCPGRVVLVGGGPGDPGLMTVAGLDAVRSADVVVTDRLGPVSILDELDPGIEVIGVGKVPFGPATPQEEINRILVEQARRGRTVVRLKGGDSFLFGRGAEEHLACTAAGVPVTVIPGVTSAFSVPALAGVPATHRGLAQGVSVISGHVPPGDPQSTLDYGALARSGTTLVLLMAVTTLPAITAELLTEGMPGGTPAVLIENGSTPVERVLRGTLATIARQAAEAQVAPPAITVIGAVAALAGDLVPGLPFA